MSSYIELFHEDADRIEKYEIAEDFIEDRDFHHWKIKYVDTENLEMQTQLKIKYEKLFTPTPYNLNYILKEYLDNVRVLKNLRGLKTPLTEEEIKLYQKFLEKNNWNNLFKTIMKHYKTYGDVFITYNQKEIDGYGKIPILKILDPADVEIVRNPKTKEKEFIYKIEVEKEIRVDGSLETQTEIEKIQLLFTKGQIIPFIDGEIDITGIQNLPLQLNEYVPMIHLQFLKKDNEEYSVIPSIDFIDSILRLHRIETNISETNDKSGANQIITIDGNFDKKSTFGPRSIAYVDTTLQALNKGKQASVIQLEITNGLESLYKERDMVVDALFSNANLISPNLKEIYAKSDSSKTVKFLAMDLINEQRIAYENICDQIKPVFKLLFPNRVDEDITLEIPYDLGISTLLDKTTYINGNVMLIKDMLREQGKTEEEIERYIGDLNQQIQLLQAKGIDAAPMPINYQQTMENAENIKPDGTVPEQRAESDVDKPDGVDNKDKTGIK